MLIRIDLGRIAVPAVDLSEMMKASAARRGKA